MNRISAALCRGGWSGFLLAGTLGLATVQSHAAGFTCADIRNDADRLACFDANQGEARAVVPGETPAQAVPSPAPLNAELPAIVQRHTAAAGGTVDTFGTTQAEVRTVDNKQELHDRIVEIENNPGNQRYFTLASGQVWKQTINRYYALNEGQSVRIYPTHWGDKYRMAGEGLKGFIQVERVR
ncbi:MAG: hypothetical protein H6978_06495 [Gammaproteobacteria bacterium]|nr:hypothetical protein [Gammaproteobacteria bacterium]